MISGMLSMRQKDKQLLSESYVPRTMPSILGTFDMTATYVVALYLSSAASTAIAGGAASFTYWLLGGLTFFLPCVIITAQLGAILPHEGSVYHWTHRALGTYWSFFASICYWLPGVLIMVSGANLFITYIQSINSSWLVAPWQQGLAIIAIILFSTALAIQRFRTVQNIVNVVFVLMLLAFVLIGLAGVVWLIKGHAPASSLSQANDWSPKTSNLYLFGFIAFAYLGVQIPLNMGGEVKDRRFATRYLSWGTLVIVLGYLLTTFSLLVVQGEKAAFSPFGMVSTVDMVLGKFFGNITAICFLSSFIVVPMLYNIAFSRLLMVGSIDRLLPSGFGELNLYRVPAKAIFFQSCVAIAYTTLVFLVAPYLVNLGDPINLASEVYNVSQAVATLIWIISTPFSFISLVSFYRRNPKSFLRSCIFPLPVLWISGIVSSLACLAIVLDTLFFSWIPLAIPNDRWLYLVGSITLISLIAAAVGSMIAHSEASWQNLDQEVM